VIPRAHFRLGSTSYVYPGDLLFNVERLAGTVADIELVLFDLDSGESNLPSPADVTRLAELAALAGSTYTVHLPLDLQWTPSAPARSLDKARRVIELTAPLHPHAYIFHLDGTGIDEPHWQVQALKAIERLLPLVETPTQLALENLESYAPEQLLPFFAALPIRRALDIGHLWKSGRDPLPLLDAWLPHTTVVHLHGMADWDHQSLAVMNPAQLDPVVARLLDWQGVVTLEVFEDDFFTSRNALYQAIERINGSIPRCDAPDGSGSNLAGASHALRTTHRVKIKRMHTASTKDMTVTIPSPDHAVAELARRRQQQLTKPGGALGKLEALSIRLAGMTGRLDWLPLRRCVVVCAGDHGVVAQGVSAYPQAVTQQMVLNFLRGGAAVNVLAQQMNAHMVVVDAGVGAEFEAHPQLVQGKIAPGTADFTQGPAMSDDQAAQAIQLGIDVARREIGRGLALLAIGEMGIGNTTSASAIIAAITGRPVAEVTGRGTGVDEAGLRHKIAVIEQALQRHAPASEATLQKVGGFEIGAMTGLMLGAAESRVPIVLDGLICTAAALIAVQLSPAVKEYLIAGHRSAEPGHTIALEWLGLDPLLTLEMRLGEGTGALLAFPLIEAAMRTLNEMATFEQAGVSERDAG
jgi:nicotinate-nucleotide--dimethylbenzimidazole phosphoribosyltransferase